MTLNLQQARADWESIHYTDCEVELEQFEWARKYAIPLLTALEARSGDMELAEKLEKLLPLLEDLEVGQACEDYSYAKGKGFEAMTYCPEAFEALREIPAILKALKGGV